MNCPSLLRIGPFARVIGAGYLVIKTHYLPHTLGVDHWPHAYKFPLITPHAKRVYHAVEHPETGAAELLLARLRRGELPARFKSWEVSRKCWHGLTDREAVKKACRLLFEYGWLIELESGGGQGVGLTRFASFFLNVPTAANCNNPL